VQDEFCFTRGWQTGDPAYNREHLTIIRIPPLVHDGSYP
jgi:hypothetical protein